MSNQRLMQSQEIPNANTGAVRANRVPHLYAVEIFGSHGEAMIEYLGRRYRMVAASDGRLQLLPQDE